MDRKKIQEVRKRGYFIEAAKKLIKEEGVDKLTVKKVADLAGFASGTLYNYFADLNALLAYCAAEFWEENKNYVLKATDGVESPREKFIIACQAYLNYFFDNPNVFKLIFLQDFDEIPGEVQERVCNPGVVSLIRNYLKENVKQGLINEDNSGLLENIISNFIHGYLLFYIMGRSNESRERLQEQLKENINWLFK